MLVKAQQNDDDDDDNIPIYLQRLRAIARYWSEITTFPYPLHLTLPLGYSGKKFSPQKTRIMGLPGSEDSLTMG